MRNVVSALILALMGALFVGSAQAQRVYDQAELDAMLAPIALQPDGVVSQVLIAATYPDEVAAAASWSRANPHMRGDLALRAVENQPWDPAVKALVAFPELLIRMDESPQWLRELGEAFSQQQAQVMDTVQALRRRAQSTGHLASTDQQTVYDQGDAIVVQPRSQIVYVPYYDPVVVYGPWWWPHYHPVVWRPWVARPVFVAHGFWYAKPHWQQRHVQVVHRPVHVHGQHKHQAMPGKWQPQKQMFSKPNVVSKPYVRVPESQRKPIVQQQMPAASGFSGHQRNEAYRERAHQQRSAPLRQERFEHQGGGQQRNSGAQQRGFREQGGHQRGGEQRGGGGGRGRG
jgi:hypothetical protein